MKHRLQNSAVCAKRRGRTLASLCPAARHHSVIVHLSLRMVSLQTPKPLGREIRLYPTQSDSRTPSSIHFAISLHSLSRPFVLLSLKVFGGRAKLLTADCADGADRLRFFIRGIREIRGYLIWLRLCCVGFLRGSAH